MAKVDKDFLQDLFNVPQKGSSVIDDEDDNLSSSESSISFDEKAKDIANDISKLPPTTALNIKAPEEAHKIEDAIKKIAISSGDELLMPIKDVEKVEAKTIPNVTPVVTKIEENVSHVTVSKPQLTGLSGKWLLKSPSEKYDNFYEEKRSLLTNDLLKDGEIPFDDYYRELSNANVDVNVSTYDAEEVGRRITEVMQHRDRIKHIQLYVNSQYFVWKQFMELLPGLIARIEYERGKQEGIVYEHLKDMYSYFGSLDGLHKSCEMVSKHLDAAYASLSRQVAIAQPQNEYDRFVGGPKPMNQQLRSFDSLSSSSGAAGRSKEVGKPTEPKSNSIWERME